jgi:hypothetical protein
VRRPLIIATIVLAGTAGAVFAQANRNFGAFMHGLEEVPAVSTAAFGTFEAQISADNSAVVWRLRYQGLEGNVTQAHIHFGDADTPGGISVYLCSNLATPAPPPGTQACPTAMPATVTGTFMAADVIGPASQGIAAGEFAELLRAIRARHTYANVHSDMFTSGEVRGQIVAIGGTTAARNRDDHHDH